MKTLVLKFDTAGDGHCLYTEALDLSSIGALRIVRASTIEFNQTEQRWEVRNAAEELLFSNLSRQACLDWEHQYFNR
jgi:hypothetical protein